MKKQLVLLAAGALALVSQQGLSQTVTYVNYKAPVFRHATDQRFSNHRQIFFMADINPALCNQIVSSAIKKDSAQAIFQRAAAEEFEKLKYSTVKDSLDMSVAIMVRDLDITPYQGAGGLGSFNTGTTYTVNGNVTEYVFNKSGEPYVQRNIKLPGTVTLTEADAIVTPFNKVLANNKSVDMYRVMMKCVKQIALERKKVLADDFYEEEISLPIIYRAKKKYPEFAAIDSLNEVLINELKKKDTKDYTALVKPYEKTYQQMLQQEYPKDYNLKPIKITAYSQLAYLYYLASDTVNLKITMDSLYANSYKFLGARTDYDARGPLMKTLTGYYASANARKYPLDSTTGQVRDKMFSTQKLAEGWILLTEGDTIKGHHIEEKFAGSILNLDAGIYIKYEITNEKGKQVEKSYKINNIKSFGYLNRLFEVHKFKPTFLQSKALSFDMLKAKSYPVEVIYNSPKIKILKENYGDEPTNMILFIRPGETEVANQGRDWEKKKDEMLKEYFKDSPAVLSKLTSNSYDLKTEKGYLQLAQDYSK
ncbi:hypothetical protein HHL17_32740 [Chitinophaga sp. G-6-1-13]|uniref:DUF3857 domain-containing protein n=1 Tax=Chitinophaga fulva TaxID=2728842 RepID=A0A848GXF5_9BACT|nr:hypothetical protein [Chitinophaga fulva]NML41999.1 hypothetical protein [Chitinophaga fulva]